MPTLEETKRIADSYLINATEKIFSAHLKKRGKVLSRQLFSQTLYLIARTSTGRNFNTYFLHYCLLTGKDSIELAKKDCPDFSTEQTTLSIACLTGIPPTSETIQIGLTQIEKEVSQILNEASNKSQKDKGIAKLLEERKELSQRIDKILPVMEKYIAKHYPVVAIG